MNGYRFRLERVRALREDRETEAKQNLAGALARESECMNRLTSTDDQIVAARSAQRRQPADFKAIDLLSHQVYVEQLERRRQTVAEELRRRASETDRRRGALTTASQERQALERLKTKTIAAQRNQLAHREQQLIDEVASNSHRRIVA